MHAEDRIVLNPAVRKDVQNSGFLRPFLIKREAVSDGDIRFRYRHDLALCRPELGECVLMNITLALFLKECLERREISREQ